ncbi:hypothetical protein D3C78_1888840 [compost metagenome]
MMSEFEKRQREKGITLWLVGMNPGVLAVVLQSPLGQAVGAERMFLNLEQVIERYAAFPPAQA